MTDSRARVVVGYVPTPIDTTHVALPDELEELLELLAENTHENWAAEKIRQGWRHGLALDENVKTHPDLVPYGALPEKTRNYDRITVVETLKAILTLGFQVLPPSG